MSAPVELLKQVPLFQGVGDKNLKKIAETFIDRDFVEGQEVLQRQPAGHLGVLQVHPSQAAAALLAALAACVLDEDTPHGLGGRG